MKKKSLNTDPIVKSVEKTIRDLIAKRSPITVYEPSRYLFQGGGKRLRAVMTVLAATMVDKKPQKAYPAAAAIELLHNFSLIHDDIMDNDNLRRGRETIHKKWDTGVAILAGDLLSAIAFKALNLSPEKTLPRINTVFADAFIGLCEGQALDKEFEKRSDVRLSDYLKMIELKTALLFQAAAQIGAMVGGADSKKENALQEFGRSFGMAFQIQDDLLDIIGEESSLGKPIGSDLRAGKKTYVALLCLPDKRGKDFISVFQNVTDEDILKRVIVDFRKFLQTSGIQQKTEKAIQAHLLNAMRQLDRFKNTPAKSQLIAIVERIRTRQN